MKKLITGCDGFIGSRFQGDNFCIDSISLKYIQYKTKKLEELTDINRIFHLGAISGIEDCEKNKDLALSLNVNATLLYLELAKTLNAQLIFASSAATAGFSFYGVTKILSEELCDHYINTHDMDTKILRLSNVYGPGSIDKNSVVAKMFKDAITTGTITAVTNVSRDFIYVDDVIKSFEEISKSDIHTSYVCTGVRTKITDLAKLIANMTGARVVLEYGEYSPPNQVEPRLEIDYTELSEGLELTHHYFKEQLT